MTDDLDPLRSLASAALDNEVTADERAQVESDQVMQGVIRSYRVIREQMRSVDVPGSAREAAVAAALAAFDASDARTGTVLTLPSGRSARDRPQRHERHHRWLGGVAAAAIVGVLGVAIVSSRSGSDSTMSASTAAPPELAADSATNSAEKSSPAADATGTGDAFDTTAAAESAPPALASTEIAAGGAADTAAAPLGDPWAGAPDLTNPDELRAYAAALAASVVPGAETAVTAAATAATAATVSQAYLVCSSPVGVTIPVVYMGQRVYLVRDVTADELILLDATTCAIAQRIPAG